MSTAPVIVTRFAPSPTGRLHLGHAYSALFAESLARQAGGRFLLRIEDIDPARCRPEFETGIFEDLAWLGVTWETPVRRQSDHLPANPIVKPMPSPSPHLQPPTGSLKPEQPTSPLQ